ncbi:MAG TPA: alpha/beta hydrolase [Pyrinomonadaceae bacterium]|jgi:pimeloyl-ACP methyl ester carboxylesterase
MKLITHLALLTLALAALPAAAPAQAPPEELGLSSRFVDLSTGVRMHYVEKGRNDNRGKVVIFLHGYTDSWRSFERNLPLLSDKFHAYAVDQRGHGDSSKPACCYRAQDFSDDLAAFMDALGVRKATIVGHSMGSLNAHKFAVEHPDRVERLVLVGSATTLVGNPNVVGLYNDAVRYMEDPLAPEAWGEFVYAFQASTFAGERGAPEEFIRTAVSESLRVPAYVWKQALEEMLAEDHSARLAQITAPTLILFGDRDGIFFPEDQHALDALIPDSTLKLYYRDASGGHPGHTGHGLHVEWPQEFVGDLEAFAK